MSGCQPLQPKPYLPEYPLASSQWSYDRPSKTRRILGTSGRLLTPEKQNMDVLSTFYRRKYGRLDFIQNDGYTSRYVWPLHSTSACTSPPYINHNDDIARRFNADIFTRLSCCHQC